MWPVIIPWFAIITSSLTLQAQNPQCCSANQQVFNLSCRQNYAGFWVVQTNEDLFLWGSSGHHENIMKTEHAIVSCVPSVLWSSHNVKFHTLVPYSWCRCTLTPLFSCYHVLVLHRKCKWFPSASRMSRQTALWSSYLFISNSQGFARSAHSSFEQHKEWSTALKYFSQTSLSIFLILPVPACKGRYNLSYIHRGNVKTYWRD